MRLALTKELEAVRYEASLAARRYELVDPAKRLVARELEARWNNALEHVDQLQQRILDLDTAAKRRPAIAISRRSRNSRTRATVQLLPSMQP